MSAQRPIAHRAFSLLVAFLLVGSLAMAPIASATGTASATNDFEGTCDSNLKYALPLSCGLADPDADTTVPSANPTDMHMMATSEWESFEAHLIGTENYVQDMEVIASLEARNAIAEAYEQGNTTSEADQMARDAVRDYYSVQQLQHVNVLEKSHMQFKYILEVAAENHGDDSEMLEEFVASSFTQSETRSGNAVRGSWLEPSTHTVTTELVNGTQVEVRQLEMGYTYYNGVDEREEPAYPSPFLGEYDSSSQTWTWDVEAATTVGGDLDFTVQNVGDVSEGGLPSQKVFDHVEWYELYQEMENQSQQVVQNYPPGFSEDIYQMLDNGEIDVSDLRGAEGTVRYMSGDGNATEGDLQRALHKILGTESPDLSQTSRMVIQYNGFTERELTEENGERVKAYTNEVNQTLEGLLFTSGAPEGGFETGVTYNTSDLNGTQMVLGDNGTQTTFEKGEFEILEMFDSSGNSVDTATYDDGPDYGAFDAEEFAAAVEDAIDYREAQQEEEQNESSGGGISIDIGDGLDGVGEGAGMLGVGLVAIALLAVVGFALDLIPGLGN